LGKTSPCKTGYLARPRSEKTLWFGECILIIIGMVNP
jgi:hypothetical protein